VVQFGEPFAAVLAHGLGGRLGGQGFDLQDLGPLGRVDAGQFFGEAVALLGGVGVGGGDLGGEQVAAVEAEDALVEELADEANEGVLADGATSVLPRMVGLCGRCGRRRFTPSSQPVSVGGQMARLPRWSVRARWADIKLAAEREVSAGLGQPGGALAAELGECLAVGTAQRRVAIANRVG
jgi:hypothetical protein